MVTPYESYVALAEKLNELAPGAQPKKTLLLNSGAEAVENAIKIAARLYEAASGDLFRGRLSWQNAAYAFTDKQDSSI